MKGLVFAILMVLSTSTFAVTEEDVQRVCANYGKSAMMIGAFKLKGDTMEKQLHVLKILGIQDSVTGKVLESMIRTIYDPKQNINTKESVRKFGMDTYAACMQTIRP